MTKTRPNVKVLDLVGNVIGEVSRAATSVAASKVAGMSVSFERRDGDFVWVAKSEHWSGETARRRVGGTFGS